MIKKEKRKSNELADWTLQIFPSQGKQLSSSFSEWFSNHTLTFFFKKYFFGRCYMRREGCKGWRCLQKIITSNEIQFVKKIISCCAFGFCVSLVCVCCLCVCVACVCVHVLLVCVCVCVSVSVCLCVRLRACACFQWLVCACSLQSRSNCCQRRTPTHVYYETLRLTPSELSSTVKGKMFWCCCVYWSHCVSWTITALFWHRRPRDFLFFLLSFSLSLFFIFAPDP